IYGATNSDPSPRAKDMTTNVTIGKSIPRCNGCDSSRSIIVSPQKLFINTRNKEYKTIKLDKNPRANNRKDCDEIAPLAINILPRKPLNGGIPANANTVMKKLHPSTG